MGQKVHPHGFRVGIIRDWDSRWFANKKEFGQNVVEDNEIRKTLKKLLFESRVSDIIIERGKNEIKVILYTAKPGLVIGKNGAQLEETKKKLAKKIGKEIELNVVEIKRPDLDSQVVAENIAAQLERRVSFRKAMKQAMQRTQKAGAQGIKVAVSGRLGGAEMARTEFYSEGKVPLQTLRADIDYGFAEALTTYGKLGVKVWIYKGEILGNKKERLTRARNREESAGKNGNRKRNSGNRRPMKKQGAKEVSDNAVNAKEN